MCGIRERYVIDVLTLLEFVNRRCQDVILRFLMWYPEKASTLGGL